MEMNRRSHDGKGQQSKGQKGKGPSKGNQSFQYQQPDQSHGYGHWSSEEGYNTHSLPVAQGWSGNMNHQQNGWGGKGGKPDQQSWQVQQPTWQEPKPPTALELQMAALAKAFTGMSEELKEIKQSRSRSVTPARTPRRRESPGSPAEMIADFPMEDQARAEDGRYLANRAMSSQEDMRYRQWANSPQYYQGAEYSGTRSPTFGR